MLAFGIARRAMWTLNLALEPTISDQNGTSATRKSKKKNPLIIMAQDSQKVRCNTCDVTLHKGSLYAHLRSRQHIALCVAHGKEPEVNPAKRKRYATNTKWHCEVCDKDLHKNGKSYHLLSKAHGAACLAQGLAIPVRGTDNLWTCISCEKTITKQGKSYHLKSRAHIKRLLGTKPTSIQK